MRFWDDSFRICPQCRGKVTIPEGEQATCPHCLAIVWFYHYRPIAPPPEVAPPPSDSPWKHPTTTLLLVAIALLGLVALFGFYNRAIVAVTCSLAAIGFAAFGYVRHREALTIESDVKYLNQMKVFAEIMRERTRELTERYNALLGTSDARVEHYYNTIYRQAELERQEAARLRAAADRERALCQNVEQRIYSMAERLVSDHLRWVAKRLRADPDSYQRNKQELTKAFDFVKSVGYSLAPEIPREALARLKQEYQSKVREQALKEEQQRIKKQMREEERFRTESEKAVREAEERERDLQWRLDEALRQHRDIHGAEIEALQKELAEARARAERAKSMAELTKVGHVYILSNIGSFGENVFKVGMTRRLDPDDRVRELGDASVPFPFDVHAMISCDNAPALENALHRDLTRHRVNRVNLRKEYFSIDLATILAAVERHHGRIEYVAEPEALQYRESLTISPDELVEVERELVEMGVHFEEADE